MVERIATRIHTERDELAADLDDFGAAVKQWSLNESDLVAPIQQMGTCLDNCSIATNQLVGGWVEHAGVGGARWSGWKATRASR